MIAILALFSTFYWVGVSAGYGTTHTLQFTTAVTPTIASTIGELDNEQFLSYCVTKIIPTMCKKEDTDHHSDDFNNIKDWIWRVQENQRDLLSKIMEHFNHTKDNHTLHMVCKCELKDHVNQNGSITFGYDWKDFMSLNFKTGTWTAADDEAARFLNKWESAASEAKHWEHYLNHDCIRKLNTILKRKASRSLRYIKRQTSNDSTSWELDCEPLQKLCSNVTKKIPKTELKNKTDFDWLIYIIIAAIIITIIITIIIIIFGKRAGVFTFDTVKYIIPSIYERKENGDTLLTASED